MVDAKRYLLDITIPGVPTMNTSARLHRSVQLKHKNIWFNEVRAAVHGKKPPQPLAHATVAILRCSGNVVPDYDNLVQGGKWLLDALVEYGVLKDDDPDNFVGGHPEYRWEPQNGRKAFVRIVVEAVEGEAEISWEKWACEVSRAIVFLGDSLEGHDRLTWEKLFDKDVITSKVIPGESK